MAGNASNLPRGQFCENALGQRFAFVLKARNFLVDVDLRVVTNVAQLINLRLKLSDRLFKVEKFQIHNMSYRGSVPQPYMISRPGA